MGQQRLAPRADAPLQITAESKQQKAIKSS